MAARVTKGRHQLGVRWPRLKDRVCRRRGHVPHRSVSVGVVGGAYWPICSRCGRGVEPEAVSDGG